MARVKKKETLTPEERLQAALVPESEQPYPVPRNWCWTQLGTYIDFATDYVANGSFASLKQNVAYYKEENYAILVKTQDFSNSFTEDLTYTDKCGYDFLKKSVLYGGELILSNIGSIGKVFRVPHLNKPMTLAPNSIMIKCYRETDYDLLYYYFLSPFGTEQLYSITTGTAVKKFNKTDLKTICLPLPPLSEQQRIVDRIESLFAKLDEAKQKAQDALDSFETRKAAILHKAFTGELTAQWRKEHGVGMESWENTVLQDVCEKIVCGKTPTGSIQPTGEIPYLKVYNIVDNNIDFKSTPQFIPKEIHEGKLKSSILKPNDVVMNIVGPPLRKIAIIPDDYPEWNMNQAIVRFRPGPSLQYRFLYYALVNPETLDDVISETKGVVGQANISVTQSRNLVIPLPSVSEQIEIVRILDDLLAKERRAKEAAEDVLEQIDLIKKAILARAFRGELGTNDPSEESAVELLKTCYCGKLQL